MPTMNIHGVDFTDLELKEACINFFWLEIRSGSNVSYNELWEQILDGKLNRRLLDWRKIVPKNKNISRS
jgi:hypothetical protein